MYIADCIKFSFKGLLAKKTRFFLTVISIFIGITSITVISAIGSSGQAAINSELDNLGLNGISIKTKKQSFDIEDANEVKELLESDCYVSSVSKETALISFGNKQYTSVIWAGEEDISAILNLKIIYGRGIRKKDIEEHKNVAVIPKNISQKMFGTDDSVGKEFLIKNTVKQTSFTVVGIVDNSELFDMISENIPAFIYIPSTSFQDMYSLYRQAEISVVSKGDGDIGFIGERVVEFLENKNKIKNGYYFENMNVYKKNISNVVGIVTLIVTLIGAVSLIVGGISVMNTMLITVNERKKEIGIKKAIGHTNLSVMAEFLTEALIIVLISCILGVVLGILISRVVTALCKLELILDYKAVIRAVLFSVIFGIVFGVYPAYKASRTNPIESLNN